MTLTTWQKEGVGILAVSIIGMVISALFKSVCFTIIFSALFLAVTITLRINIELRNIKQSGRKGK